MAAHTTVRFDCSSKPRSDNSLSRTQWALVYNLPFKGSPTMPVVSVTRLHLASQWSLPAFLAHTLRSSRQARGSAGFITGWLSNDSEWGFWTSTVWESAEAMRAFRNSDQHLKAMPKLLRWCDEGAFVHWEQQEDCAPGPAAAYERLLRDGKVSKVDAPSARQQAGTTVGAMMPRPGQPLNARRRGRTKS